MIHKKLIVIILLLVSGVFIRLWYISQSKPHIVPKDSIIFEQTESWGPCPNPIPNTCYRNTTVYSSGAVVIQGDNAQQFQLNTQQVELLNQTIIDTKILGKDCSAPLVLDYSADYTFNMNNQHKEFKFPGCQEEIKAITKILGG